MAFVSIGQKYGFVSAGDEFRRELAEERQKAEAEKLTTARSLLTDGVSIDILVQRFNLPREQILAK